MNTIIRVVRWFGAAPCVSDGLEGVHLPLVQLLEGAGVAYHLQVVCGEGKARGNSWEKSAMGGR